MRMLLIDGNTKEFPAYLASMSKMGKPVELLYTNTVESGLKQIKKGGIGLVLLAKPLFSAQHRIRAMNPTLKVVSIEGPGDVEFLELEALS